jgi:hypothetical protein
MFTRFSMFTRYGRERGLAAAGVDAVAVSALEVASTVWGIV